MHIILRNNHPIYGNKIGGYFSLIRRYHLLAIQCGSILKKHSSPYPPAEFSTINQYENKCIKFVVSRATELPGYVTCIS